MIDETYAGLPFGDQAQATDIRVEWRHRLDSGALDAGALDAGVLGCDAFGRGAYAPLAVEAESTT